jgi:spore germination cell wall hydrolase CwlJ-like protein
MKKYFFALILCMASPAMANASCNYEAKVETLALNIYHEARGEGHRGMQMVGEVVLNRVSSKKFPNTICGVIQAPGQFSWYHDGKPDTPRERGKWNDSLELAKELIDGDIQPIANGATHFLNPNAVRNMPPWSRVFPVVAQAGGHTFYKATR